LELGAIPTAVAARIGSPRPHSWDVHRIDSVPAAVVDAAARDAVLDTIVDALWLASFE